MKFSEHFFKTPRFWVAAFSTSILALSMFVSSLRTDYAEQQRTYQLAEMAAIAKATGAIPPGWTAGLVRQADAGESSQQHAKESKSVVKAEGSSCDVLKNYSDANSQALQASGRTCVLVTYKGKVSSVQGKWYQLAVPDPAIPGNFYKCGDAGGQNDSEAQCAEFATRYSGREIRIAVLDGGYLNLN